MVGLTGYPNVGKSSTINALFGAKKTAVAATPGKTKHFQTLNINERLTLCDCPGLVLPKYAASKAEMVAAGARALSHALPSLFSPAGTVVLEAATGCCSARSVRIGNTRSTSAGMLACAVANPPPHCGASFVLLKGCSLEEYASL